MLMQLSYSYWRTSLITCVEHSTVCCVPYLQTWPCHGMTHRFHSLAAGMAHKYHTCDVEVPTYIISRHPDEITDHLQICSIKISWFQNNLISNLLKNVKLCIVRPWTCLQCVCETIRSVRAIQIHLIMKQVLFADFITAIQE